MNLILFEERRSHYRMEAGDPRLEHVRGVLRCRAGDGFDVGVANGPKGRARVLGVERAFLEIAVEWGAVPPAPPPVELWVALPRPQTARKILFEATTLGVSALRFFAAERSDPAYARSSLWHTGEWRGHVWRGAEQAFDTHLPEITWTGGLGELVAACPAAATRWAPDVYEATVALGSAPLAGDPLIIALGPERGWSAGDRNTLRAGGFCLCSLGPRVLRVETAALAALVLAHHRRMAV